MTPDRTNIWLLVGTAIAVGVTFVDALIGGETDLALTTAIAIVFVVALSIRLRWRRPAVPLRTDLVEWLRDRAAVRGETVEDVLDRAVAVYRADLTTGPASPEAAKAPPESLERSAGPDR